MKAANIERVNGVVFGRRRRDRYLIVDKWCEKCNDDVVEEGAHKDDSTFKPMKGEMDHTHQNIRRVPTQ